MSEKERSYMLAIPVNPEEMKSGALHVSRLAAAKEFQIGKPEEADGGLELTVSYGGEDYRLRLQPMEFEVPELYRIQHFFPDVDIEVIQKARAGLGVVMEFGDDALTSYHLQLKIIHAIFPQKLAVFDDSSEKILSGKWVELAAESSVAPAPRYLYTVQAVSCENGEVWLHSHGLNRCGLPELEILGSDQEYYQSHYSILETMANRMMELSEPLAEGEPLYLARLSQDVHLVTTYVDWKRAMGLFDADILGGEGDRGEGHREHTAVLFAYPTQEDFENGKLTSVRIYDELLKENPIYLLTTSETLRMKALAIERLDYMKRAAENPENHILIKLGLEMDASYGAADHEQEHIWFELMQVLPEQGENGEAFLAKLTQEPYYISGLHAGDMGEYRWDQITDWLIYTPQRRLTPDDVYLLELE